MRFLESKYDVFQRTNYRLWSTFCELKTESNLITTEDMRFEQ